MLTPLSPPHSGIPKTLITSHPALHKISVTTHEGIRLIHWHDVLRCTADSNYTRIQLKDHTSMTICKTLMKIERVLPGRYFIRVHKSHLLRIDQIRLIRQHDLVLETGESIPVSKAGRKILLNQIQSFTQSV